MLAAACQLVGWANCAHNTVSVEYKLIDVSNWMTECRLGKKLSSVKGQHNDVFGL